MVYLPCTVAILRFPRRYPSSFLLVLIPLALLIYTQHERLKVVRWTSANLPPETTLQDPAMSPPQYVSQEDAANSSSRILLVSAFYPLSKSKHSMNDYKSWITTLLNNVETDFYFYTPPDMEAIVRSARNSLPIHINTTFSSPFDIPPLSELRDKYSEMAEQDRERDIHSPELYAIWAAKEYFLDEAIRNSGKEYDYAFWNDAGSMRNKHAYKRWPDVQRVDKLFEEGSEASGTRLEDLIFIPMRFSPNPSMKFWQENMGPIDNEFSEGSFFGGKPAAISWFRNIYYAYHNHYLFNGHLFVGKDQTLINALIVLFPDRFVTVWPADPSLPSSASPSTINGPLGYCPDIWFYYQFFLASSLEREKMQRMWDSRWVWRWDFWKAKGQCQLTSSFSMSELLRRPYVLGGGWKPPGRIVEVEGR